MAVSDIDAEAAATLARLHGAEARATEEIVADEGVDAVLIATSTDTHADLIEAACAAGKAVLCEKPVDLDLGRALACQAATRRGGRPVMVGFNRRFDPNFARLKAAFDAGEIGRGELLSITSFDPGPPPVSYIRVSGGLFRDMTIHDFDLACWIMGGAPAEATAVGSSLVDEGIAAAGDVDTAVITLRWEDGRLAVIRNSRRAVYGYDQRVEILRERRAARGGERAGEHGAPDHRGGRHGRQARALLPRALREGLRRRVGGLRRRRGAGNRAAGDAGGRRDGARRGGGRDALRRHRAGRGHHPRDAGGRRVTRRKLGCCTWTFGSAPLAEVAERAARAGLDGVELFGDVGGLDPVEAREALGAHGLEVFSLTPADADISHPDPAVRRGALDYYERLADFAAAIGRPILSCHGLVRRIVPVTSREEEDALLVESVARICEAARGRGLEVVFEILNRYETHQVRTVAEGLALLDAVGAGNLKLLPDAYHMNVEEADPAGALRAAGGRIGLYHAADSNRGGVGEGHTDFRAQFEALNAIGYRGPIVLETSAPGPNPFTPDKGEDFRDVVERQLAASRRRLAELDAEVPAM